MTSNYKYTRNWENQQKAIFDGVGEYDIPVIEPEQYHHVEWIPFNKAKSNSKRKGMGIHHFIDCLACGNLRFKSREEHAFLLSIML